MAFFDEVCISFTIVIEKQFVRSNVDLRNVQFFCYSFNNAVESAGNEEHRYTAFVEQGDQISEKKYCLLSKLIERFKNGNSVEF